VVGRPFAGPPGIPENRLKVLRDAFKKALYDPELLKAAEKTTTPINFIGHEECEKFAKGILNMSPDIIATIKKAYGVK
jgi:tripartite-type tricarboxylate transporter receptor subunit TctC